MSINTPDKYSEIYKQFLDHINNKVNEMIKWLSEKNIEYVWNNWINDHLYRLYVPEKDLLFDFEYYPVYNNEYNYIRVNFNTDVVALMEKLFPATVLDTKDLEVWILKQRASNHFLRENGASPVYDKNALRIAWVKDKQIYQCIVMQGNWVSRNVTKRNCSVQYGTYMLLRYLNEKLGIPDIYFEESLSNSMPIVLYQIIGIPYTQSHKKKIWWNPNCSKWKIKREQTNEFISLYYPETRIYKYSGIR